MAEWNGSRMAIERRKERTRHPRVAHGQRYPMPGSDPVKKRNESRAAAPKGRCPVERGYFETSVLPSDLRGL